MSDKDLLHLFGFDDEDPAPPAKKDFVREKKPRDFTRLPETALELDAWGLRRGEELSEREENAALEMTAESLADFYALAFEPDPVLHDDCKDDVRLAFIKELVGNPEYTALHAHTACDVAASEVAAFRWGKAFTDYANTLPKPPEYSESSPGEDAGEGEEEGEGGGTSDPKGGGEGELDRMKAAHKALLASREEVEELEEARSGIGGPGVVGEGRGGMDPAKIAALFKRVKGSPALRKICELAGKFRLLAQGKQRQKALHGSDEVAGVAPGSDVARLLPQELALLADPDTEDWALKKIVEGEALCLDLRSSEPAGKGPLVISVDESGSMRGQKVYEAKALALTLAWVAAKQGRWVLLVGYSGGAPGNFLELSPRKRWDEDALCAWLEHFYSDGSSLDVPLDKLPDYCDAHLKTIKGQYDYVAVTDAALVLPSPVEQKFLAWKRANGLRFYALVVGGQDPGDLYKVADNVWAVDSLALGEEAVGKVLEI